MEKIDYSEVESLSKCPMCGKKLQIANNGGSYQYYCNGSIWHKSEYIEVHPRTYSPIWWKEVDALGMKYDFLQTCELMMKKLGDEVAEKMDRILNGN
jgi:hypothetical protein